MPSGPTAPTSTDGSTACLDGAIGRDELYERVASVGELTGREPIDVEMITPLVRTEGDDDRVSELLSGDFIGAFGGFLARSIRRHDFLLGWTCTERWVAGGGHGGHGVDEADLDAVLAALGDRRDGEWHDTDAADQLGRRGRWQLFLLGLQFARVIAREAQPGPSDLVHRVRSR